METVRVKRKGQVTIPINLRRRYEIAQDDLLGIEPRDSHTIVIRLKKLPEPGRPVGSTEQKKILMSLEKLRKNWR